jgi:sugar fermentation stimulation protein A
MKYKFSKPLTEGVIESRPNRFIMNVMINDKIVKCHCPSTGRIGDNNFSSVKCLLSKSSDKNRKTPYTVEAVYKGRWIGINQVMVNRYVEHFLKSGQLAKMIKAREVKREVSRGKSRIDFLINSNDLLEVKMPLISLPGESGSFKAVQTDRMIKHFNDIVKADRAIFALCFVYDAKPFAPPAPDRHTSTIHRAARRARAKGVENWQINMKIDKKGVELIKYFRLHLFE